ncbi:hypothetical protein QTP70_005282 [Hemibagrus guttatus]|uniref:Endonuclease-reverse transcriptase n=1 Tax=Hemibagrus guttatus TaxID=175788 RepID=A0AAE0Q090_9TELE|nr:hypothetical protein QTP70_005282 [Hemibagrus guttatus]
MCVNEREGSGTVRLQGEEVKKVQEFKYLGSTVQSNGECAKEVKKRVQAGWNGWRKVSGVLCDRKISARIKGKVYRTVVRPAMLYGLETVSLRKRQESELEVAELKMLRFSLGVTRLDRIRNKYIRGTAHVGRLGDKVMEARLRWFGHVQRRESEYIGRRMLDMELPGRRQRGKPKRRETALPLGLHGGRIPGRDLLRLLGLLRFLWEVLSSARGRGAAGLFVVERARVQSCSLRPFWGSDHCMVVGGIELEVGQRGRGFWQLNTTVLQDPSFCKVFCHLYTGWRRLRGLYTTQIEWWEDLKRWVAILCRWWGQEMARRRREAAETWSRRLCEAWKDGDYG